MSFWNKFDKETHIIFLKTFSLPTYLQQDNAAWFLSLAAESHLTFTHHEQTHPHNVGY